MRYWWVRIRETSLDQYGRWVPTGQTALEAAQEYVRDCHLRGEVVEWVLL